ncbi:MAG: ribonuclease R [Bacilli bacterium]|nr:ribonuclease R [Clostridium sp.]MDY6015156.1 ribonuclease R [Bacilli bacterium]
MKEKILSILKESDKALSINELDSALNLNTIEETKAFSDALRELEDSYEIYRSNKNRYMLLENSNLRKGILRMNKKGFGFVEVSGEEEDIFIAPDNINKALNNDTVIVEILNKNSGEKREGRIVKTLERDLSTIVGEIYFKKDKGYIIPDDKKLDIQLEIDRDKSHGAVDGHKVVVKILRNITKNRYKGEVVRIIGHKNDPGVDILSIVCKYEINDTFPEEVIEELDSIPEEVREQDKKGRKDLTDVTIFTIDGDDTKDIDDAISVEKLKNGNYKLGVHIADVSYYVKEGSPLDKEAMDRGTSVYLVDRVIPMLPHKLSNGICSLNPGVERLAISCVMEIDNNGKTVDYEIFPSIIKSRLQMTYKKVNQVIEKNEIPEGYEPFVNDLKLMDELSQIIRKAKINRGYIDFDVDEAKIIVDENCHPTDIVLRNRGRGENLIEDFMIQANECVATHIFYMDLPFIYRVHEYPKEEKIRDFISFVQSLGYTVKFNTKDISPKAIQNLINQLKDKKEFKVLSSLLLRNMQKAIYLPQNLGHYGLASKCYTHFTSPIRRYPDTTVHRLLRTYLFNDDMSNQTINKWQEKLVYIAENSSFKERESVECEREVEDMKMAEYMEDHIGEEYKGIISGVTNFGMFIQLDNLVEGLIHVNDMKDYFSFDEVTQSLIGERTKEKFTLGDEVLIKVKAASKEAKTIDFELVKRL